jgi:type III protein arginine methyltransferase
MEGDVGLIERAFGSIVTAARGNPRALLTLAENAYRTGDVRKSWELAKEVLSLQPESAEITSRARLLVSRLVPNWHFPMMLDDIRNNAFVEAIERGVEPGMRVLDIGSGSGLLAMMAARAGAAEVHSCELNPAIATTAERIVQKNGFADRVTIHASHSGKLEPADVGGLADLIVAEIIGKDLVCEEVLPTMRDVARRLAKPDAKFIPQAGEIRVALAHYRKLDKVAEVCGFDLSPFNELHPSRFNIKGNDSALTLRGEPASLFAFDFGTTERAVETAVAELVATDGPINGVVQWFKLQMDDVGSFENAPGDECSVSWALQFFPFVEPISPAAGDRVRIAASVTRNLLHLWRDDQ